MGQKNVGMPAVFKTGGILVVKDSNFLCGDSGCP